MRKVSEPHFIIIIPARYGSSRFPGKPLAKLGGKEVILRVCERASESCDSLYVATDDERIARCVESNGFKAIMTPSDLRSGTDRVMYACRTIPHNPDDVIINIQGDEPFIETEQIEALKQLFVKESTTDIATLVTKFPPDGDFNALRDSNLVKVVISDNDEAMYFSRSVIPYLRGVNEKDWLSKNVFYTHIGVYAYRVGVLDRLTSLPSSTLERAESLEQLRWLQTGYRIRVAEAQRRTIGIDTSADLAAAEEYIQKRENES